MSPLPSIVRKLRYAVPFAICVRRLPDPYHRLINVVPSLLLVFGLMDTFSSEDRFFLSGRSEVILRQESYRQLTRRLSTSTSVKRSWHIRTLTFLQYISELPILSICQIQEFLYNPPSASTTSENRENS